MIIGMREAQAFNDEPDGWSFRHPELAVLEIQVVDDRRDALEIHVPQTSRDCRLTARKDEQVAVVVDRDNPATIDPRAVRSREVRPAPAACGPPFATRRHFGVLSGNARRREPQCGATGTTMTIENDHGLAWSRNVPPFTRSPALTSPLAT